MNVIQHQSNYILKEGKCQMTNEELALKIQAGQFDLILELWNNVRKLIAFIARKYLPGDFSTNRIEVDDLIQSGYFGFIKAINAYDASKNYKFSTYLTYYVKNAIRRELGIDSRNIKKDALLCSSSIDSPLRLNDDESEFTLADLIPAEDKYEGLCEKIATDRLISIVLHELDKLDEFHRDILIKRYIKNMSLSEVAKELNCSRNNVHLHEKTALKKLRNFKILNEIMMENNN